MRYLIILFTLLSFVGCSPKTEILMEQPEPLPEPELAEALPVPEPIGAEEPDVVPAQSPTPALPEKNDASDVEYDDNLMITNVRCHYQDQTISFTLKNTRQEDIQIWQGEIPTPTHVIKIGVNGRQFGSPKNDLVLQCTKMTINPGQEVECYGENIFYRGDAQFNQQGKNKLLGQMVGENDVTLFHCG